MKSNHKLAMLVAASVIAAPMAALAGQAFTYADNPVEVRIEEDDPRWDCSTMGNRICGPCDQTVGPDGTPAHCLDNATSALVMAAYDRGFADGQQSGATTFTCLPGAMLVPPSSASNPTS